MQTYIFLKKVLIKLLFIFMLTNIWVQNVGIGTALPKAHLHVVDTGVLFSAPFALPAVAGPTPVHGAATV